MQWRIAMTDDEQKFFIIIDILRHLKNKRSLKSYESEIWASGTSSLKIIEKCLIELDNDKLINTTPSDHPTKGPLYTITLKGLWFLHKHHLLTVENFNKSHSAINLGDK